MNLKPRPKTELSPFARKAAEAVAIQWFPLTVEEILGPGRHRWVAEARGAFCTILKAYHMPPRIIAGFTGRSISAVNYAIRADRSLFETDMAHSKRVDSAMERLAFLRIT